MSFIALWTTFWMEERKSCWKIDWCYGSSLSYTLFQKHSVFDELEWRKVLVILNEIDTKLKAELGEVFPVRKAGGIFVGRNL
jgi:hypothetical protein